MDKSLKIKESVISLAFIAVISALVIVGLYFHEPWFDEAQAYLIARDASWHDILFFWTHYEGHPPLWHIMLKFAIILGLPYELALKSVNFIFFEAVLFIIEFRSPFSRITKTIIPLSYFVLYQYSVVSRPYILLMLAVLLTAMFYKDRYNKPVRYCLSLMLMCALHSYGIALAGGIVIADLISDAVHEHSIKKCVMRIINNKKLLVLYTVLLAFAVFLIFDIMPRSDTYASEVVGSKKHSYLACFFLSYFFIPSETLITSYSSEMYLMQNEVNPALEVISAALLSLFIWVFLIVISKKRKMLFELFVPYFFLSILTSVYIMPHHFGMFLIYLLYVLWIASDKKAISLDDFDEKLKKIGVPSQLTKKIAIGGCVVLTSINLYWSGRCYYNDIKNAYYPGKGLADWIKKENLTDQRFLAEWYVYAIGGCITANPFFDDVFYYCPFDDYTFITHILSSEADTNIEVDALKKEEKPDFIICESPYHAVNICKELNINERYTAIAYHEPALKGVKDKCEIINVYVMCTNETYKELYGKDYKQPTFEKKEG